MDTIPCIQSGTRVHQPSTVFGRQFIPIYIAFFAAAVERPLFFYGSPGNDQHRL